jgi:hypothetical protein
MSIPFLGPSNDKSLQKFVTALVAMSVMCQRVEFDTYSCHQLCSTPTCLDLSHSGWISLISLKVVFPQNQSIKIALSSHSLRETISALSFPARKSIHLKSACTPYMEASVVVIKIGLTTRTVVHQPSEPMGQSTPPQIGESGLASAPGSHFSSSSSSSSPS